MTVALAVAESESWCNIWQKRLDDSLKVAPSVKVMNDYLTHLHEGAANGCAEGHLRLAILHTYGIGVPLSTAKAALHYVFAARENNTLASIILGTRIVTGCALVDYAEKAAGSMLSKLKWAISGIPSNQIEVDQLMYKINQGSSKALVAIGNCRLFGCGDTKVDVPTAVRNFEAAAKQGEAAALGTLGKLYFTGHGDVPIDLDKSLQYFTDGADLFDVASTNGLGIMHFKGLHPQSNNATAETLFRRAAQAGYPAAIFNLGLMTLKRGAFVEGMDFVRLAAAKDLPHALWFLGHILLNGKPSAENCSAARTNFLKIILRSDHLREILESAKALDHRGFGIAALMDFLLAAELGSNAGCVLAADTLRTYWDTFDKFGGENTNVSTWYVDILQKAVDRGESSANLKLGLNFYQQQDFSKALAFFSRAAMRGVAEALYYAGCMHMNGEGTSQDFHIAKRNLESALDQEPRAYIPVTLALIRLNFAWWAKHFGTPPHSYFGSMTTTFFVWGINVEDIMVIGCVLTLVLLAMLRNNVVLQ